MYTVLRKGYLGIDDDICADGEFKYMKTKKEAESLANKLTISFGKGCNDLHPWKGSTFYVQKVSKEYINFVKNKGNCDY